MIKSILTKSQFKTFTKNINYEGVTCTMSVTLRYDDKCGNGHNTFSITGRIRGGRYSCRYGYEIDMAGCIHDEIKKYFPEFAHLIKWHLCGSQQPLYYIENTLYFASNSTSSKYKAGEPNKWDKVLKFDNSNITHKFSKDFINFLSQNKDNNFEIVEVPHKEDSSYDFEPKYTFKGYDCEWYQCPFDTKDKAIEYKKELESKKWTIQEIVTGYQKGKQREFNAARQSAIWEDATDEQLSLPSEKLKKVLLRRLPKLMKEFKHDIEALGFIY